MEDDDELLIPSPEVKLYLPETRFRKAQPDSSATTRDDTSTTHAITLAARSSSPACDCSSSRERPDDNSNKANNCKKEQLQDQIEKLQEALALSLSEVQILKEEKDVMAQKLDGMVEVYNRLQKNYLVAIVELKRNLKETETDLTSAMH